MNVNTEIKADWQEAEQREHDIPVALDWLADHGQLLAIARISMDTSRRVKELTNLRAVK